MVALTTAECAKVVACRAEAVLGCVRNAQSLADELFVAGRTPAERDAGRRVFVTGQRSPSEAAPS
ncbi:hypothetical protein ACFRNJ_42000 [Streptomyces sp. NPDC056721]|uniref:hypothetical protein n=1 Tax=Streptomyces sp. NPDC056721 TaxID=3345923 RepID=UPI0036930EF7